MSALSRVLLSHTCRAHARARARSHYREGIMFSEPTFHGGDTVTTSRPVLLDHSLSTSSGNVVHYLHFSVRRTSLRADPVTSSEVESNYCFGIPSQTLSDTTLWFD